MFKRINSCDGFYSGSLDVRFTKICDNACSFCIEKPGLPDLGTDVDAMVKSTLESGQKTILILGGEPLLMIDKVLKYVKSIRPHVREIFLTTSLPRSIDKKNGTFLELMEIIDGLNVSLQHYNWKTNNEILQARHSFNRLEMLQRMLANSLVADKTRVSINLVKGGIDSPEELYTFLDVLKSMGCKHVKINELQHSPETYVSFEKITGIHLPSPYSHGCQREIELVEGMKVALKRACFLVEPSLEAGVKDLLKVAFKKTRPPVSTGNSVLYENGKMEAGWITSQERSES